MISVYNIDNLFVMRSFFLALSSTVECMCRKGVRATSLSTDKKA